MKIECCSEGTVAGVARHLKASKGINKKSVGVHLYQDQRLEVQEKGQEANQCLQREKFFKSSLDKSL